MQQQLVVGMQVPSSDICKHQLSKLTLIIKICVQCICGGPGMLTSSHNPVHAFVCKMLAWW